MKLAIDRLYRRQTSTRSVVFIESLGLWLLVVALTVFVVVLPQCDGSTCPSNPDSSTSSSSSSSSPVSLSSVVDADVVGFVPPPQVLPTGSLIIPMDQNYQSYTDGKGNTRFNFNCYGHVVKLLHANIPCKWIIATLKQQDQPDIVNAPVKRMLPTAGAATMATFYSGPIAVHAQYAATALALLTQFNSDLASITTSLNTNVVTVFQTTGPITVSVRHELTNKPYVGISNAGGYGSIAIGYMNYASLSQVTHYSYLGDATALRSIDTTTCYTLIVEMHFADPGTNVYAQAAQSFLQSGGNVMVECAAISTYENNGIPFVSTAGVKDTGTQAQTPYTPDLPIAQYYTPISNEAFQSRIRFAKLSGGGSQWEGYDACVVCTTEANIQSRVARAMAAKLPYASGSAGGVYLALGGHDWLDTTGAGGPSTLNIASDNGARLYYNALLIPSKRPDSCALNVVSDPNVQTLVTFSTSPRFQSLTYTIVVSNTGAPAQGVTATINLDPTFLYQGYTVTPPGSVSCTISGFVLMCSQFGTLSGSGAYTLSSAQSYTVLVTVKPQLVGVTGISASISSTTADSDTSNNQACQSTTICDLPFTNTLSVIPSTSIAQTGSSISYTVTLTNHDSIANTNMELTLQPSQFAVSSLTPGGGSTASTSALTWDIASLAAGASIQLLVQGTVTQPNANGASSLQACITESDRIPQTQCASGTTNTPTLQATKSLTSSSVKQGQLASFRITGTNGDPSNTMSTVQLSDTFPSAFMLPPTLLSSYIYHTGSPVTLSASTPPAAGSGWTWTRTNAPVAGGAVSYASPNGQSTVQIVLNQPVTAPFRLASATISMQVSSTAVVNFGIGFYYYSVSQGAWVLLSGIDHTDTTLTNQLVSATIPVADLADFPANFVEITTYANPVTTTGSYSVSNVVLTFSPILITSNPGVSSTISCAGQTCYFSASASLPPGYTVEANFQSMVQGTATIGTTSNIASATSDQQPTTYPVSISFPVLVSTMVSISLSAPASVYLGDSLLYTITVTSAVLASNVQVAMPNPDAMSLSFSYACSSATNAGTPVPLSNPLNLNSLLMSPVTLTTGTQLVITLCSTALGSAPASQVTATATATSNQQPPSASATTALIKPLIFTKSTSSTTALAGTSVTYTLTAKNVRPYSGAPVPYAVNSITDTQPAGVSFTAGTCTLYVTQPSSLSENFQTGNTGTIWNSPYTASPFGSATLTTAPVSGNLNLAGGGSVSWSYTFPSAGYTYSSVIMSYNVDRSMNGAIQLAVTAGTATVYLSTLPPAASSDTSYSVQGNIDLTPWMSSGGTLGFAFSNSGSGSTMITGIGVSLLQTNVPLAGPTQSVVGSTLTIGAATLPNQASVVCSFSATLATPVATGAVVSNTATASVGAPLLASYTASAQVTVIAAINDFVSVVENTQILVPITRNDYGGAYIDPYLTVVSTGAMHGSTAVTGFGSVDYMPNPSFVGIDTFQYTISNWAGTVSSIATVTVQVDAQVKAAADSLLKPAFAPWTEPMSSFFANDQNVNTLTPGTTYSVTLTQPTSGGVPLPTCSVNLAATPPSISCTAAQVPYTFGYTVCDLPAFPQSTCNALAYVNCASATVTVTLLYVDTDHDGIYDYFDIDSDNDGILNSDENPSLPDGGKYALGSSTPNYKNPATAGCVIVNGCCANYDADGDGIPNFLDLDSDNDGIPDLIEGLTTSFLANGGMSLSVSPPSMYTLATLDSDANGVLDGPFDMAGYDVRVQTAPNSDATNKAIVGSPDTDSDLRPDYKDLDSDADGVPDVIENRGMIPSDWNALDADHNSVLGPPGTDADSDGILDVNDSNPTVFGSPGITTRPVFGIPSQQPLTSALDRDLDGVPDFRDLDSDNDGVLDLRESGIIQPLGTLDTDSNGVIDTPWVDGDSDGIPASIDSNDGVYGSTVGCGTALNTFPTDTDGDRIPDMYDLDSDNDGVSDLVESGNAAAIAGDTDNNGVINGPDSDGDGIQDAADTVPLNTLPNWYGSPSQPAPVSNTGGVPNMLTRFSNGAGTTSDLIRSGRSQPLYDTNNDGLLDSTTDKDYDGIMEVSAPLQIDFQLLHFGGLGVLGPSPSASTTTNGTAMATTPDFVPTSVDISTYVTPGYYALDPSSVVITSISGRQLSLTQSGFIVTDVPRRHSTVPTVLSVHVCDTSPYHLCTTFTLVIQPYTLYWLQPISTTTWYMYFDQVGTTNMSVTE